LRKNKTWQWEEKHDKAWQELQHSLQNVTVCYVLQPGRPALLITDACEEGGGGSVLQLQKNDEGEEKMRFIGHWAWKWGGARVRYSVFEKELLAGILLLASQLLLLRNASAILWLTDQSAIVDFLKNPAPETKRVCRWWYFTKQFRLTCQHVSRVQNEFADFLSGGNAIFEKTCAEKIEQAAKFSFAEMDEALDLVIFPVDLGDLKWTKEELLAEFTELAEIEAGGGTLILDNVQWTLEDDRIYRETRQIVPTGKIKSLMQYLHLRLGHPAADKVKAYLNRRFYFSEAQNPLVDVPLQTISRSCEPCLRVKTNSARDRGIRHGQMPIPEVLNAEVAVDLVYTEQNRYVLFMCETLTGFVQAVPTCASVDENELARLLFYHWIALFGPPGRITSDNEIRWRSTTGPWSQMLHRFGIESHFATPYRSNANGTLERRIQEFVKQVTILHSERVCQPGDAIPLSVCLLNSVPHLPHGYSAHELFLQRASWMDAPVANDQWIKILGEQRERLATARGKQHAALREFQTDVHVGSYVFIHHRRFPSQPTGRFGDLWHGPFLVTGISGRVLTVAVNNQSLRVDRVQTKVYRGDEPMQPAHPPVMSDQEMAEGLCKVEAILEHKQEGRQWLLKTMWENSTEVTWNPLVNFVNKFKTKRGMFLEETAARYVAERGSPELKAAVERLHR
jgi:hypothetical protein